MKLSKNRIHKIKLKRNSSRKKYNLRRKKGKYENSRKKGKRNTHLKNKTMKIYIGGKPPLPKLSINKLFTDCKFKAIPKNESTTESFVNKKSDERKTFVTKYFLYKDNSKCVMDARNKLLSYLKALYNKNGDDSMDEISNLKGIWEDKIPMTTLSEKQRKEYPIDMNVIKGTPAHISPVLSTEKIEENKKKQATHETNMMNELRELCKNKPKLPEDTQETMKHIKDVAKDVKQNNPDSTLFTENNLEFKKDNVKYYHVETTSEGECLYSSFIFSMFYKGIGNWYGKGWVPEIKVLGGGKVNYMGNLRLVLAKYICNNLEDLVKSQTIYVFLRETACRPSHGM